MVTSDGTERARCFSIVKRMWSNDRSELALTRIRSMALVKFNTNQTCTEFFNAIKNEPSILRAIKGGKKYEESSIRMKNKVLQLNQQQNNSEIETQCEC